MYQGLFSVPTAHVPAVRLWAFGVGFSPLFLGSGAVAGVIAWRAGNEAVDRTLVTYVCLCLCMFLSGIVFLVADRLELGRAGGRVSAGALPAGGPPLVALIAAVL